MSQAGAGVWLSISEGPLLREKGLESIACSKGSPDIWNSSQIIDNNPDLSPPRKGAWLPDTKNIPFEAPRQVAQMQVEC